MAEYYTSVNGRSAGPFAAASLAAAGVTADTLVWAEGMADWTAAKDVPELAAAFGRRPTPPVAAVPIVSPFPAAGPPSAARRRPAGPPPRPLVGWLAPAALLFGFACFFLGMMTVSFMDVPLFTLTGAQMAFGGNAKVEVSNEVAPGLQKELDKPENRIHQDNWGVLAFVITGLALGLAFTPGRFGTLTTVVLVPLAAVSLVLLTGSMQSELNRAFFRAGGGLGSPRFVAEWRFGYYGALASHLVALAGSIVTFAIMTQRAPARRRKRGPQGFEVAPAPAATPAPDNPLAPLR